MKRSLAVTAVVLAGVGLAACGSGPGSAATTQGASKAVVAPAGASCSPSKLAGRLYQKGYLTVATDKPAYTPWFDNNNPSNGKGYESAVAYAVASQLGFTHSQVHWAYEPFNDSYAPGSKKFDFDINEISYSPARATAVTFSGSYFADRQALVALKSSAIAKHHSPADLKKYIYGDQVGSTSLSYINTYIQPTSQVKPYETLNDVKSALQTNQIDAFVTDTPTAQYISSAQVPGSVMVGQFPSTGEHFGLVFAKGDPLVACVDKALDNLAKNGTLTALEHKWLSAYVSVPTIKP